MKTVASLSTVNQAYLLRSWLEANGLECFIPEEMTAGGVLPNEAVFSGVRIQVAEEDVEKAREMIKDYYENAPEPVEEEREEKEEEK